MVEHTSINFQQAHNLAQQYNNIALDVSHIQQAFAQETQKITTALGAHAVSHIKTSLQETISSIDTAFSTLHTSIASLHDAVEELASTAQHADHQSAHSIHTAMNAIVDGK